LNSSEGNRLLWLATDTNGVIVVKATSLRLEKSKLRYVTQLFDRVSLDVIQARDGWKLVGARGLVDDVYNTSVMRHRTHTAVLAKHIFEMSLEETVPELSVQLQQCIYRAVILMSEWDPAIVSLCARAQVLGELGYIERQDYLDVSYLEQISQDSQKKQTLSQLVDQGILHSHLGGL
jgi:hypothetical protein